MASLEQVMVLWPLMVSSHAPVIDAVILMSSARQSCPLPPNGSSTTQLRQDNSWRLIEAQASCVLVLEQAHLVGIVTEQALIDLMATGQSLTEVCVADVMAPVFATLQPSELTDLMVPLQRFQDYEIRHLPILNNVGQVVGLLAYENLLEVLSLRTQALTQPVEGEITVPQPSATVELQAELAEWQRRERTVQLLYSLTQAINEAEDFNTALEATLHQICDIADWSCGEVWLPSSDQMRLEPGPVYCHCADMTASTFEQESQRLSFALNEGLPGRVWVTQDVEWIHDISKQDGVQFLRRDTAIAHGIKAACGVPILAAGEVIAVLVFFAKHNQDPDQEFLHLIRAIASQLGQMIRRKQAEAALQQSEAVNRAILEAIPDLLIRVNAAGEYLDLLSGGEIQEILLPATTIQHPTVYDVLPKLLADQRTTAIQEALSTGQLQTYEQWIELQGKPCWEEVRVVPLNSEQVLVMVRDITDRKQSEEALRQNEAKSRAILAAIPDLMFRVSAEGTYLGYVTEHRSFDIVPETINPIGQRITDMLPPELAQRQLTYLQQALQTNELQIYEQQLWIRGKLHNEEVRVIRSGEDEVLFMIRDISDRKRAEAALRESEATNRAIIQAIPDLLMRMDRTGLYWDVLSHGKVNALLPPDSLPNPTIFDTLPEELALRKLHYAQQALDTGKLQVFDQQIDIHGERWYEEVRIVPLNQNEVLIIVRDITEQKQHDVERQQSATAMHQLNQELETRIAQRTAALRDSEERFRHIFEQSPVGIAISDLNGRLTRVNTSLSEIMGYSSGDLLELSIQDLLQVHEPDNRVPQLEDLLEQTLSVVSFQQSIHRHDRTMWVNVTSALIFNVFGRPSSVVYLVEDISDRKQAELLLRSQQQFLRRLIDTVPHLIFVKDWEGRFQLVNQATATLYNTTIDDLVGKTDADFNPHLEEVERFLAADREVMLTQQSRLIEETVTSNTGEQRYFQTIKVPLIAEEGQSREILGVATDITKRRQIELALQKSEAKLRNLSDRLSLAIKSGAIGIWEWDVVDNVLLWDERMYELYGIQPPEASEVRPETYQVWSQKVHPEDLPNIELSVQQAFRGEKEFNTEFRVVHPDGAIRFIKAYGLVQRNPQGDPQRMIGINFDITERKQAENALARYTREVEDLYNNAPCGYHSLDAEGRFININNTELQWLGYTREEVLGRSLANFLTEESRQIFQREYPTFIQEGRTNDLEYHLVCKDGRLFPVLLNATAVRRPDGSYLCSRATSFDIRERKAAEQILAQRERYLAMLVEIQRVLLASKGVENFYGEILQQLGQVFQASRVYLFENHRDKADQLIMSQRAEWCQNGILSELNNPQLQNLAYADYCPRWEMVLSQGQVISGRVADFPPLERDVLAAQGIQAILILPLMVNETFWGFIGFDNCRSDQPWTSEEIHLLQAATSSLSLHKERCLTEAALEHSNRELVRATRLKDEFLANMSHELRTPLNAVLGMSEGLQEEVFGELTERQRRAIATIERSGKHLLELINDILDLSKVEADKLDLHPQPVAISYLCESSLVLVRPQALQKNLQLTLTVPPRLPDIIVDERRIRQVLINLLTNAIKFTPDGGSVQFVVQLEHHGEKDFLCFSIIDTGIGIAPENLNKLFQPFVQIDSQLNRRYAGTGLGLALVRRLVDLHGGTIEVSSVLGQGSCFTVRLPYARNAGAIAPLHPPTTSLRESNPSAPVVSPLILLAEDNEVNAITISSYLTGRGYRLIYAKNGQEAIALIQAQKPDLVLMDIQMPEVDGLEAIHRIRADDQFQSLPIIALTALAMPDDQEKCLTAGATAYLAKPIKLKQLVELMQTLLAQAPS